VDVRDIGLRGRSDDEIASHARARNLIVLSADLGFGNVARFPNELPSQQLNRVLIEALRGVSAEEIRGNILIIEPGRVRLRKG
jgi:predicted nuclease of predicted toxin-antitoxin system